MKISDLLEKRIATLKKRINVQVDLAVDQTVHGEDRQYRHTDEQGNVIMITHDDIVNTISKSLPKLGQMIMDGEMNDGDTVVVYNSKSDLNVVGKLELKQDNFKVITIMRKKDFKPKGNDIKVTV